MLLKKIFAIQYNNIKMNKNTKEKTRIYFTKSFKRWALIEFANGKKASEILKNKSNDKKYASKLIHKWKKELYQNPNLIALLYENTDFEHFQKEINIIGEDNENDDFV